MCEKLHEDYVNLKLNWLMELIFVAGIIVNLQVFTRSTFLYSLKRMYLILFLLYDCNDQ